MLWWPMHNLPLPTRHWVGRGIARASPLFRFHRQVVPFGMAFDADEEVSEGLCRAKTALANGNDLSIAIQPKGEDQIFVQIPMEQ
jgi:hypothetical protein